MDEWGDWAFWAAAGVFGAIVWLVRRRSEHIRPEAIRQDSLQLGMTFLDDDEKIAQEPFFQFPLFQHGSSGKAKNVLRGTREGYDIVLFDYEYFFQSMSRQTVAAFRFHTGCLPAFNMRASGFPPGDLVFESHPEFQWNYRVRAENEGETRELFGVEVLEYFDHEPGWALEGGGEWLLIYRASRRIRPEELPEFVQETTRIARLFGKM